MDRPETERVCAIRENVADLIGANRFRTWFGETTHFQLEGQQLDVLVANDFVHKWIVTNYMPELVEAARRVIGADPAITVRVLDAQPALTGNRAGSPTAMQSNGSPAGSPATRREREPRPVLRGELETFVVGPSNELAYSVTAALVRNPGQAFKHLILHGGCGLGKTHLLQAVCNGISRTHPELVWHFVSGEVFTNEFIAAFRTATLDQFRARYRNIDLLVIDDIHFLSNKKATQEEFLHTYNAIDACGKMVVLSSDRHPRSMSTLSEPLVNRLVAAMVVEIGPPDYSIRREILRRKAAVMQCDLPDMALDFLAQRVTRNIRELEGALQKLVALASLTREPLTLDRVRRAVEEYVPAARAPEPAQIVRQCAQHFGVTVDALNSSSRDRTVTLARGVAIFLLRRHTRLSYPEIGRLLGDKRHSTALMAARRIQDLLDRNQSVTWHTAGGARDAPLRCLIDELEQRLLQ